MNVKNYFLGATTVAQRHNPCLIGVVQQLAAETGKMQHLLTDISLVGVVTREVYRLLSLGKPMTVRQLMVTGSLREEPVRNALQRGVKQGWAVEAGPVLVANSVGRMGSAKTYLTAGKLKEKATTAGIIEIALATRTPLELAWSGVVA